MSQPELISNILCEHSVHPCRAVLRHQMAGGAGCSAGGCRAQGLQRQRGSQAPEHSQARRRGALPPNGVSSSLLPHCAAFITALGVGFEGFLWSLWVRLCHPLIPPWAPACARSPSHFCSVHHSRFCLCCLSFYFLLLCIICPCFLLLLVHTVVTLFNARFSHIRVQFFLYSYMIFSVIFCENLVWHEARVSLIEAGHFMDLSEQFSVHPVKTVWICPWKQLQGSVCHAVCLCGHLLRCDLTAGVSSELDLTLFFLFSLWHFTFSFFSV